MQKKLENIDFLNDGLDGDQHNSHSNLEQGENEDTEDYIARLQEANKQLYARVKKSKEKKDPEKKEKKAVESKRKTDVDSKISEDDKIYYFARMNGTRTGLRKLQTIMSGTGKTFNEALKSDLYKGWEMINRDKLNDIKSQLGASRGGTPTKSILKPSDKEAKFLSFMGVKDLKK